MMKGYLSKHKHTVILKKKFVILWLWTSGVTSFLILDSNAFEKTPENWSAYSKYPSSEFSTSKDGVAFVPETVTSYRSLQRLLNQIAEAEDILRRDCTGASADKMIAVVRNTRVLVWPERFKQCEDSAQLVRHGNPHSKPMMNYLNRIYRANYPPPVGNTALADTWEQKKATISQFPGCDDASRSIVFNGSPGNAKLATDVFEANKNRCPAGWVALFQPEPEGKTPQKSNCSSATSENQQPCTAGLNAASLDAELNALQQSELTRDLQQSTESREKVASGAFKRGAKRSFETLGQSTRGSVPIYSGQVGEVLNALAQHTPTSTTYQGEANVGGSLPAGGMQDDSGVGCSSDFENSIIADYNREMNSPTVTNAPLDQNQCVLARVHLRLYQRLLPYAQRCKTGSVSSIQSAISDMQRQQREGCFGRK